MQRVWAWTCLGVETRVLCDRFASWDNVEMSPHLAGGARSGVLDELALILHSFHATLGGGIPRFVVDVSAYGKDRERPRRTTGIRATTGTRSIDAEAF